MFDVELFFCAAFPDLVDALLIPFAVLLQLLLLEFRAHLQMLLELASHHEGIALVWTRHPVRVGFVVNAAVLGALSHLKLAVSILALDVVLTVSLWCLLIVWLHNTYKRDADEQQPHYEVHSYVGTAQQGKTAAHSGCPKRMEEPVRGS